MNCYNYFNRNIITMEGLKKVDDNHVSFVDDQEKGAGNKNLLRPGRVIITIKEGKFLKDHDLVSK